MISANKISRFIGKLISKTKMNEITWKVVHDKRKVSLEGTQNILGKAYEVKYSDRHLVLFKYSDTVQTDEYDFKEQIFYKLTFIDDSGDELWEFPWNMRETYDLYDAVRFQVADLANFFNSNDTDVEDY